MTTILAQMMNQNISDNVKKLYLKEVFELLSLLFNVGKEMNIEQCPFLADDKNVKKIKSQRNYN